MLAELIPTRFHAALDYLMGLFLLSAPWLVGYNDSPLMTGVTITFAFTMLTVSLLTQYEMGLIRLIPVRVHLAMDILFGAAMALSPFLLGMMVRGNWVLVVGGILEMYVAVISCHTTSGTEFMNEADQHMGVPRHEAH